ncbi:MAG: aminotransferase class I/II-fold pyridoxal phosphate-dependent enzyme [Vicinamibacterales bacterium]
MNRRSFVQTVGVGAVGALTALKADLGAQVPAPTTAPAARRAAGAAANAIRIGANENPYGPASSAIDAIARVAGGANRYPGVLIGDLMTTVAAKHEVATDMVLLSGGSGDILDAMVKAYTSKTKALVTGLPSYEQPSRGAQRLGSPVIDVPLTSELRLDTNAMAAKATGAGLVYICNPNNPTSTVVPLSEVTALIEAVVKASPTTRILVDEAYFEYADMPGFGTATPLAKKYPQVIVARTLSKIHGMAGMRVGYALAQPKTLAEIREFHSGSGLSSMSLAAANASLKDTANMEKNRTMNRAVRAFTAEAFTRAGYTVAASDANFIFVNIKRDARGFQDACRLKGVMVGRAFPPMTTWARISIGTQDEMDKAVPVFMSVLAAAPTQTASFDHLDLLPSELT